MRENKFASTTLFTTTAKKQKLLSAGDEATG
jgi:hypothetical protein